MIPATLRLTLIIAVICYFFVILYFLKQKALNLKYTLLWLVRGKGQLVRATLKGISDYGKGNFGRAEYYR